MQRWLLLILLAPSIASAQYIATDEEAPAPEEHETQFVGWIGGSLESGYSTRDAASGGIMLGGIEGSLSFRSIIRPSLRVTYGGTAADDEGTFAQTVRVEAAYHTVTPFWFYGGFRVGAGYIAGPIDRATFIGGIDIGLDMTLDPSFRLCVDARYTYESESDGHAFTIGLRAAGRIFEA